MNTSSCILQLTVPLTRERYNSDLSKFRSLNLFAKEKDFLKNEVIRIGEGWDQYEKHVVIKAIAYVHDIHTQSDCVIDYDVTFGDFKRALSAPELEYIFLVAHHFQRKNTSYIEFADGGYTFSKVIDLIRSFENPKSVFFFVCDSMELKEIKKNTESTNGYISISHWKMPFYTSIKFIKMWLYYMESMNMEDAYAKSVKNFLNT